MTRLLALWLSLFSLLPVQLGAVEAPSSAAAPLPLTLQEQSLLAAHPVLRLGVESGWHPIEFIDENGHYSGIISSYMHAIESRLGIRFEIVHKENWADTLAAFNRGEIDALSALGASDALAETMRFTTPYIHVANGIIVRNDEPYTETLGDLASGKRLAVVQGYGSNLRAVTEHPQLVAIPVATVSDALSAVSLRRADAAVVPLASAYWVAQHRGLSNLRVASHFDESEPGLSMALQPALENLLPTLNRALNDISAAERLAMRARWTPVQATRHFSQTQLVIAALACVLLLLLLGGWIIWLLARQRRRARLQHRAETAEAQFRAMLEAMPAQFWTLHMPVGRPPQFTFHAAQQSASDAGTPSPDSLSFEEGTQTMAPDDRARLRNLLEQHGRSGTAFSFEYQSRDSSGNSSWAYLNVVPKRQADALVWYGCAIDITQRKALEAALESSRNQLAELAAGVPGALWQFRREQDGSQSYTYMSDGIRSVTGRTPDETNQLMRDKSFISVHPEDQPILKNLMLSLAAKPGIDEARYRLHTVDGGWKWVQVAARAMPLGPDGAMVWNGVTLDATRLHETEQALRFEQARFQQIADSIPGALWELRRAMDGTFHFDYLSEGVSKITGRHAADIVAGRENPLDQCVPEDLQRVMEALAHSAESNTPLNIEFSSHAADGRIVRLHASASVRHEHGEPIWTGVLLDISDEYQLQQQLADARSRIADIASHLPGAMFQIAYTPNGDAKLTYLSDGISLFTRRALSVSNQNFFRKPDYIHPDDHAPTKTVTASMLRNGGAARCDFRLLDVDGKPHWVHCAMTSRRQVDGSILINGLLLDAEQAKQLEADLRIASERAEAASLAKSRFLANMSHEIRTPMNAIIGLAHIAMTYASDPAQQERIGKVHSAGKALLKLLNDVLEYSRLDAGKYTPVNAPFDLRDITESLRMFCLPNAQAKGLAFTISYPEETPQHWFGDSTRIQQVLLNLITNAIKFTDTGTVTLTIRALAHPHSGLEFVVQDTGIGMSAAQLERVFEAFEQGSQDTAQRHGGSGLGLSISRELVHALGGTIQATSQPGNGTIFCMTLPLQRATAKAEPLLPASAMMGLTQLAAQIARRDIATARSTLLSVRKVLSPLGLDKQLDPIERMLAGFDFESAEIALARLIKPSGPLERTLT